SPHCLGRENDPDHKGLTPKPVQTHRSRRGFPDDQDFLPPSSAAPYDFRPKHRGQNRRSASPWQKRAACPVSFPPAASRKAQSFRPAAPETNSSSRSSRPEPEKRP